MHRLDWDWTGDGWSSSARGFIFTVKGGYYKITGGNFQSAGDFDSVKEGDAGSDEEAMRVCDEFFSYIETRRENREREAAERMARPNPMPDWNELPPYDPNKLDEKRISRLIEAISTGKLTPKQAAAKLREGKSLNEHNFDTYQFSKDASGFAEFLRTFSGSDFLTKFTFGEAEQDVSALAYEFNTTPSAISNMCRKAIRGTLDTLGSGPTGWAWES